MNLPKFDKRNLYILPLMLLLASDALFYPFPYAVHGNYEGFGSAYEGLVNNLVKLVGPIAVGIVILKINKFSKALLIVTILALFYLVILVFESLYFYNNPLQYPHVILKLFNLFVALAIFTFYRDRPSTNFGLLMTFMILGLLMQILMQPKMLTLQAFVSHDRGLPASTLFLICLPCLYYFNEYMTNFKLSSLIVFLFLLLFILLANHRSVWATIAFSLLINIIVLRKNIRFNIGRVLGSLFVLFFIAGFILAIVISYNSEVEEKIVMNITNILNPTEDKTGSWRYEQIRSYLPMVESNFLTGMRWKGFELPVQFYNSEAGVAIFEANTGHHFHSFYLDIIFYFGLLGLILFILVMIWPLATLLRNQLKLNNIALSFFIFSISGLIFGMAYNLPFSYWNIFGVTIVLVNKALKDSRAGVTEAIA